MFKHPFSYRGKIGRKEYALSILFMFIITYPIPIILANYPEYGYYPLIAFFPVLLFLLAQSVKRSHDTGRSGWYVLIPFFIFVLLFEKGHLVVK